MGKNLKMNNHPVKLAGAELKKGDKAPEFTLTGNLLEPITKADFNGKILVISCVPSLDTPVCEMETRRFNQEADKLPENVTILTVSRDLPFAQTRWCAANGVEKVVTASDYRDFGFARDYGVLLSDLGLLTRAIFVIDGQGIIQYIQFVEEVTQEPDYETVLQEIKKLM